MPKQPPKVFQGELVTFEQWKLEILEFCQIPRSAGMIAAHLGPEYLDTKCAEHKKLLAVLNNMANARGVLTRPRKGQYVNRYKGDATPLLTRALEWEKTALDILRDLGGIARISEIEWPQTKAYMDNPVPWRHSKGRRRKLTREEKRGDSQTPKSDSRAQDEDAGAGSIRRAMQSLVDKGLVRRDFNTKRGFGIGRTAKELTGWYNLGPEELRNCIQSPAVLWHCMKLRVRDNVKNPDFETTGWGQLYSFDHYCWSVGQAIRSARVWRHMEIRDILTHRDFAMALQRWEKDSYRVISRGLERAVEEPEGLLADLTQYSGVTQSEVFFNPPEGESPDPKGESNDDLDFQAVEEIEQECVSGYIGDVGVVELAEWVESPTDDKKSDDRLDRLESAWAMMEDYASNRDGVKPRALVLALYPDVMRALGGILNVDPVALSRGDQCALGAPDSLSYSFWDEERDR